MVYGFRRRCNGSGEAAIPTFCRATYNIDEDRCAELLRIYRELLQQATEALCLPLEETDIAIPHNVVIVKEWLMVIPRRKARSGLTSANAAGMMGMVWVTCKEELEAWEAQGPTKILQDFGLQREGVDHLD